MSKEVGAGGRFDIVLDSGIDTCFLQSKFGLPVLFIRNSLNQFNIIVRPRLHYTVFIRKRYGNVVL